MYYVSSGEQNKMYTLRCQEGSTIVVEGENVAVQIDYYIRNLSIDRTQAVETAKVLGYTVSKPEFTLLEIQRNQAEAHAAAIQARMNEIEVTRIARESRLISEIEAGYFPFGKLRGCKFEEANADYLKWWISFTNSDDNVCNALQKVLSILFPDIVELMNMKSNGEYFGEEKTRYKNLRGTVVEKFSYETFYGWTTLVKIILDSGELLILQTGVEVDAQWGDYITFDCTVKSHDVYKDENQTKILRIKITDNLEFE